MKVKDMNNPPPPSPTPEAGRAALKALLADRSLLPALKALHAELGDTFNLAFPGFRAVVLAGPEASRFVLVEARKSLVWRNPADPVTKLLRHGLLVEDGESHAELRRKISPMLHKRMLPVYLGKMLRSTDQVLEAWEPGSTVDMLVEMRRVALLIIIDSLFDVDFSPHLDRLFPAILKMLAYISPGVWLVWPKAPRIGYKRAIQQVDEYLYGLIAERRASGTGGEDLLSRLAADPEMTDDLIRDQMLTMLIAGHDTSTALLAWALGLMGKHPQVLQRAVDEVDQVMGIDLPSLEHMDQLQYLGQVIDETLRIYPPIHIGNRHLAEDLDFQGYRLPAGRRLMYSIYATHHDEKHWNNPEQFDPDRFAPGVKPQPYTFVPFGGGPRNCIGAAFAQVEAKVVLARILQRFKLRLLQEDFRVYMGATLEPRPGVLMQVSPRR
jgi:cytochrome P450